MSVFFFFFTFSYVVFGMTTSYVDQLTSPWKKLQHVQLNPHVKKSISWELSNDGVYLAKSAYKAHTLLQAFSTMPSRVWKKWDAS